MHSLPISKSNSALLDDESSGENKTTKRSSTSRNFLHSRSFNFLKSLTTSQPIAETSTPPERVPLLVHQKPPGNSTALAADATLLPNNWKIPKNCFTEWDDKDIVDTISFDLIDTLTTYKAVVNQTLKNPLNPQANKKAKENQEHILFMTNGPLTPAKEALDRLINPNNWNKPYNGDIKEDLEKVRKKLNRAVENCIKFSSKVNDLSYIHFNRTLCNQFTKLATEIEEMCNHENINLLIETKTRLDNNASTFSSETAH